MSLQYLMSLFGWNPSAHLERWNPVVQRINSFETEFLSLSDEQFLAHARTIRLACYEQFQTTLSGNTLALIKLLPKDILLAKTFALVREASRRVLGLRHYDVQLLGAMALHEGALAEMRTGEGKTLVITPAAVYNAFCGIKTHVVTVNHYLASRDSAQMGRLYAFLGLTTGLLSPNDSLAARTQAYQADITYGVNHEFGFDYLKDHMIYSPQERRQQGLGFAIIDEVDSILIDEARTPLIITGQQEADAQMYILMHHLVSQLPKEHVEVDPKMHTVWLTEEGYSNLEEMLTRQGVLQKAHHLYDPQNHTLMGVLNATLQAHHLYQRDQQYVIHDGKIVIVDESTGRPMPDRRWSHGIHQAIEAKEGQNILPDNKTLGQITYQNYFKLYSRLSGLTGTAMTQRVEFEEIYQLTCHVIPTNKPMIRKDHVDAIYRTKHEKFEAICTLVASEQARGRPILIGTPTVEESESVSNYLKAKSLKHQVLNAKNHQHEALIIANAGAPGSITVATNMAGRGTDIILGGNPELLVSAAIDEAQHHLDVARSSDPVEPGTEPALLSTLPPELIQAITEKTHEQCKEQALLVCSLGGLLVIGTARHDSRRVDNQLRGRSGRQGDPGESRFLISLEDDLFRIYGQKNALIRMIDNMKLMDPGESLESPFLNKALARAQSSVESHHYNARKQLMDYDGVPSAQRAVVYQWRNEILDHPENSAEQAYELLQEAIEQQLAPMLSDELLLEQIEANRVNLQETLAAGFNFHDRDWLENQLKETESPSELFALIKGRIEQQWKLLSEHLPKEQWQSVLHTLLLQNIDQMWQDHIDHLASLMDGIHLRSFAQKDPKQEYKREAFDGFIHMRTRICSSFISAILHLQIAEPFESDLNATTGAIEDVDAVELNLTNEASLPPQQQNI